MELVQVATYTGPKSVHVATCMINLYDKSVQDFVQNLNLYIPYILYIKAIIVYI